MLKYVSQQVANGYQRGHTTSFYKFTPMLLAKLGEGVEDLVLIYFK